jgi:hypothetical protein
MIIGTGVKEDPVKNGKGRERGFITIRFILISEEPEYPEKPPPNLGGDRTETPFTHTVTPGIKPGT